RRHTRFSRDWSSDVCSSDLENNMKRILKTVLATGLLAVAATAHAAEPFKIGLILPMTGPFASTGKQIDTAVKLYMQQHGDTVAGRKIQVILKDDTGLAPEITRRLRSEEHTSELQSRENLVC